MALTLTHLAIETGLLIALCCFSKWCSSSQPLLHLCISLCHPWRVCYIESTVKQLSVEIFRSFLFHNLCLRWTLILWFCGWFYDNWLILILSKYTFVSLLEKHVTWLFHRIHTIKYYCHLWIAHATKPLTRQIVGKLDLILSMHCNGVTSQYIIVSATGPLLADGMIIDMFCPGPDARGLIIEEYQTTLS